MKCIILALIVIVSLVFACRHKEQLQATIFERRELNDSSLIILFRYKIGDQRHSDSAIIKNVIISNDSINLIADPSNPGRWIADL